MSLKGRKQKSSAPKAISDPEDFWIGFLEYEAKTKSNPILVHDFVGKDGNSVDRQKERPLLMEGFENHMCDKFDLSTVSPYIENRDGRYQEYVAVISRVRKRIRQDNIEGGMAGIYHPNLTARIHGISDKIEQEVSGNVKLMNIDPL
jgi:hypothetical protein